MQIQFHISVTLNNLMLLAEKLFMQNGTVIFQLESSGHENIMSLCLCSVLRSCVCTVYCGLVLV